LTDAEIKRLTDRGSGALKRGNDGPQEGFELLIASDGSAAARVAVTTRARFSWPTATRGFGVVGRRTRVDYRRSVLLAKQSRASSVKMIRMTRLA
jgi:hypothetical protein